ncbi:hypothetical protein CPC08DRAFT_768102 [Agrocybe pediades]|nr:hypothetical protein CPC08DRAFT_768102 [Agrocybe pediades]
MVCADCDDWRALALAQLSYTFTCTCQPRESCGFCNELSIIESQIRDSVAFLQSLLQKHKSKKEQINDIHSPIVQLPPEISSTIFLSSLPGDVFGHYPSRKKREAIFRPLLIGAICKAWRDVAWATPQLWAQPFFDDSIVRDLDRHPLALEWLSRAQRVPVTLNIILEEPHFPLSKGTDTLQSFLKVISDFPFQLKTISARMTLYLMQYMFRDARKWDNIDNLLLCPTAGSVDSFLVEKPLFWGQAKPSPRNVAIFLGPVTIDRVNIDWSMSVRLYI